MHLPEMGILEKIFLLITYIEHVFAQYCFSLIISSMTMTDFLKMYLIRTGGRN